MTAVEGRVSDDRRRQGIAPGGAGVPVGGARARRAAMILPWVASGIRGWVFPAFMLSVLVLLKVLLLGILVSPRSDTVLGAFAEEFRVWCFGYDPATGRVEWAYVVTMLLEPIVLGGVILLVWWRPLADVVRTRPTALAPVAAAALVVVALLGGGMVWVGMPKGGGSTEFPAAALRTSLGAPSIELENQEGRHVSLASLKGKVAVLTASYSTCGHTCPRILAALKQALAGLPNAALEDVRVLSVTLDPVHDTQEVVANLARAQGLAAPTFNLLIGDETVVNATLDSMSIARSKNERTGVIDHANAFILVDRQGRIAYRLTLGDTQEHWLGAAIRALLQEPAGAPAS